MDRVVNGIWRLRAAVLTLAGALGVHQARDLFASPAHERELADVHVYIPWLMPLVGILVFLAIAQLAMRLGRPGSAQEARLPRARILWLAATVALIHVFVLEESLETVLADGHLPAVADLLGAGGWTAIPLAAAAGGGIALLLRGAAKVVRWAIDRRRRPRRRPPMVLVRLPYLPLPGPQASVLARRLAGRAPPALS
jgi:hypothetical protein